MNVFNRKQYKKKSGNKQIGNEHFLAVETVTVNDETTLIQFIKMAKYNNDTQIWSNTLTNNEINVVFTPNLLYLNLSNNSIEENGAKALAASLQFLPNLLWLDLVDNSIGDGGAIALAGSLQYLPNLTVLNLVENSIGGNGMVALAASFQYLPNLMELDLSSNPIDDNGMRALVASLQYFPNLLYLNLSSNPIEENGAIALAKSLHYLTKLTYLYLHNNSIGPGGASALAGSLQYLPNLTYLFLDANLIGKNGAIALSGSLQYLLNLTFIGLNNNSIGPDGAIALAASLQYLPNLVEFNLDNNSIGDKGMIALAGSLQYLPKLTYLSLNSNSIGDNGMIALAGSLQYLPTLIYLSLSSNSVNMSFRYYYHYVRRFPRIVLNPEVVTPIDFPGVSALSTYTSSSGFLTRTNIKHIMRFPSSTSTTTIDFSTLTDSTKMKTLLYDIVSTKNIILNVLGTYNTILDDLPIAPIYATINITNNSISEGAIMNFCSKINKLYELKNVGYPTITYTYNKVIYTHATNIISPNTEYITTIKMPNNKITHINTLFNTLQYTSSIEPNKDKIIANIRDYFKSNDITTTFYVNVHEKEELRTIAYTVTIHFTLDVMPFVKTNVTALLSHDPNPEPNLEPFNGQNNEPIDGPSHKSNLWIYIILSIVIILILGLVYY